VDWVGIGVEDIGVGGMGGGGVVDAIKLRLLSYPVLVLLIFVFDKISCCV